MRKKCYRTCLKRIEQHPHDIFAMNCAASIGGRVNLNRFGEYLFGNEAVVERSTPCCPAATNRPQRMAKRGMAKRGMEKNDHPSAPQLLPPTGKRSFSRISFIGKRSYFRADFIGKRTSLQKTHYLCTIKKAVTCCTERLHNGLKNTSLQIQIECC